MESENHILIDNERKSGDFLRSYRDDFINKALSSTDENNNNCNSSIIDIESNCCNFNNNQRNTRRIIINVSLFLMNIISLAGIITLLIK